MNTQLKLSRPELRLETVRYRKTKSIDLDLFKSDLASICEELSSIDDPYHQASQYNKKLRECLNEHAPIVTKSFFVRPKVNWYDSSLIEFKRIRRKHERAWVKCKSNDYLKSLFKQALHISHISYVSLAHFIMKLTGRIVMKVKGTTAAPVRTNMTMFPLLCSIKFP